MRALTPVLLAAAALLGSRFRVQRPPCRSCEVKPRKEQPTTRKGNEENKAFEQGIRPDERKKLRGRVAGFQGLPAPSMTYQGLPASYRTATAAEGETAKSANHANERRAAECSPDHETEAQNFTYIYRHMATFTDISPT
jgi:hypothetical protein